MQEELQPLVVAHDWLGSFLQEFSDLDEPLELLSSSSDNADDSFASSSSLVRPPKAKRQKPLAAVKPVNGHRAATAQHRRLKHNERVKKLYDEIHALLMRLQPDPAASSRRSKTNWKQRAASERHACDRAQLENDCLKQRLAEGVKLREEMERLLLKQQELMSRSFLTVKCSLVDDDTHVYGLLKSDLFKQQFQLETSLRARLDKITQQSLFGSAIQANERWDVAKHNEGLRMDVDESVVMPFNAAMVNAAICKYTQAGSIQVDGDNVVDRVVRGVMDNDVELRFAVDHIVGGRQVEGRSIMRRIRGEMGTVLFWETMSYWQGTNTRSDDPRAVVRESGWSFIAPVQDDLSVCYFQKAFRIRYSDGSRMKKRDPLVRKIVHTCQEFHRIQSRRTENILVDRHVQQERLAV